MSRALVVGGDRIDGINNVSRLERLRQEFKETLQLDLDDYDLAEQSTGEFNSTFLGVRLNTAFQPIYDSKAGELYGHEALLRPSLGGELPSSPDFAFTYAEQAQKLVQFDRVSRTLHVLNFRQIYQENGLLFLKVHPKLLTEVSAHGQVFEHILHSNALPTKRVVIEIHEGLIEYDRLLFEAIENYRERGYKVAIEHFGGRKTRLDRLWKLNLDYVKLDTSIIQQAENLPRLHKALHGLIETIRDVGAEPVVTGIETQTQLDIAIASGAHLLQGYLLGKPAHAKELQPSIIFNTKNLKVLRT